MLLHTHTHVSYNFVIYSSYNSIEIDLCGQKKNTKINYNFRVDCVVDPFWVCFVKCQMQCAFGCAARESGGGDYCNIFLFHGHILEIIVYEKKKQSR